MIISVVSFANAKGGQIFIGVHDSGKILGFRVTLFKEQLDGVVSGVVNSDINSLYIFIKDNPNQNANTISNALKIPLRTIQRKLKKLKDDNKIEFVGSPKIGRYYAKK